MCNPALIMGGVMVAQALMSTVGEAQQAAQDQAYQTSLVAASQQQEALNRQLAIQSFGEQSAAENMRLAQEDATATENVIQSNIRAARAIGEARVDSAAVGVTGLSIAGLYDEYGRENSRYTDAVRLSREQDLAATATRKEGFKREAENRIRSFQPYTARPVAQPSVFGSLLKIGAAGAAGYATYSLQNPRKSPK